MSFSLDREHTAEVQALADLGVSEISAAHLHGLKGLFMSEYAASK